MKVNRSSITAQFVAMLRATYAVMQGPYKIGFDPASAELIPPPFDLPARLVQSLPGFESAIHWGLGTASFGLSYHVALRTFAIDQALVQAIIDGATQCVILGSGFDNRAHRIQEMAQVHVFEVDYPATFQHKESRMQRARFQQQKQFNPKSLTRVPIDFERDNIDEVLIKNGFNLNAFSFWIWEGVTMYLTPIAIDQTLQSVAKASSGGSRIAITYTDRARGMDSPILTGIGRWGVSLVGEPFRTYFTDSQMREQLNRIGFSVLSDDATKSWERKAWHQNLDLREWERLVVAEKIT